MWKEWRSRLRERRCGLVLRLEGIKEGLGWEWRERDVPSLPKVMAPKTMSRFVLGVILGWDWIF